jgi:hypothetical protein
MMGQTPIFWTKKMCHPRYGCHKNEVLGGVAIFERGQHETGEDSVKTSASLASAIRSRYGSRM